MAEFTPYRDAGSGGVVYDIATRDVVINGTPVRVGRSLIGWVDSGGAWHELSDVESLPTAPARNTYGTATAVPAGGTVTVVSFVADAAFRLRGMLGTGTADGAWRIKFNGVPKYGTRTSITEQEAEIDLPNPDAPGAGVTVTIEVTNNGTSVADFEATLLGE